MEAWFKTQTLSQVTAPVISSQNPRDKTLVIPDVDTDDSIVEISGTTIQDQTNYIQSLEKKVKELNRKILQTADDLQHHKQLAQTFKHELDELKSCNPKKLESNTDETQSLRLQLKSSEKLILETQSQVETTNGKFAKLMVKLHAERDRALTAE